MHLQACQSFEAEVHRLTLIWVLISFILKLPSTTAAAYQSEKCLHFILQ